MLAPDPTYSELFNLLDDKHTGRVETAPLLEIFQIIYPGATEDAVLGVVSGRGTLGEEEFCGVCRSVFFAMSAREKGVAVQEVVKGLREARRRRFLMFADSVTRPDVNQEELSVLLAGSPSALQMYEEIFAYGLPDVSPTLPLEYLSRLLTFLAPSQPPAEHKEILCIANAKPGSNPPGIDLVEFLILMRGARLNMRLSDMVEKVRSRLAVGVTLGWVESSSSSPPRNFENLSRENRERVVVKEARVENMRRTLLENRITDGSGYRAFEIELELARSRAADAEQRAAAAEQRAAELEIDKQDLLYTEPTKRYHSHDVLRANLERIESTHGQSEALALARQYDALLTQYAQNAPGSLTIPGIANHISTGSTSSCAARSDPFSPSPISTVSARSAPPKPAVSVSKQSESRLAKLAGGPGGKTSTQRWK